MTKARVGTLIRLAMAILVATSWFPTTVLAQSGHVHPKSGTPANDSSRISKMADHAMSGTMNENMMKHMELSPLRTPTHDDTVRATKIAADLRRAIQKYQDTNVASADGYKMFLPNVKEQRVYHFTNYKHAAVAAFRFDPARPTSILYERDGS